MPLDRDFLRRVRALSEYDLRRLSMFVGGLLEARVGEHAGERAKPRQGKVTYRSELVRCGRKNCNRCPHGPYWYAYWREGGRLRSRYLGKVPPAPAS